MNGQREDICPEVSEMKYPELLGLSLGRKKIILLFNESKEAKTVSIKLKDGYTARTYYSPLKDNTITIPPEDAEILLIEK